MSVSVFISFATSPARRAPTRPLPADATISIDLRDLSDLQQKEGGTMAMDLDPCDELSQWLGAQAAHALSSLR